MSLSFTWHAFSALSNECLYEILKLRQEVFVVEQKCIYLDADGLDVKAYHLVGRREPDGDVLAYLRVISPGVLYAEAIIGRLLVVVEARRKRYGEQIVREALKRIADLFPGVGVRISAQCYLEQFYLELGFKKISAPYLEDGIPHVAMRKS